MKKFFLIFFIFTISLVHSQSDVIKDNQDIISSIENNWNSISTMSGRFEQIDADNNIEYRCLPQSPLGFPTIEKSVLRTLCLKPFFSHDSMPTFFRAPFSSPFHLSFPLPFSPSLWNIDCLLL